MPLPVEVPRLRRDELQQPLQLRDVGEYERGLPELQRAVAKGYFVAPTLSRRRQFDPLRSDPAFQALMEDAAAGRERALAAFGEAGGERLLGAVPERA